MSVYHGLHLAILDKSVQETRGVTKSCRLRDWPSFLGYFPGERIVEL
jgi:hypothetical protein